MKKIISLFIFSLFSTSLFAGEYPDISIKDLQKQFPREKLQSLMLTVLGVTVTVIFQLQFIFLVLEKI